MANLSIAGKIVAALFLCGCAPDSASPVNETSAQTPQQAEAQRQLVIAKFNERAKAINARMRESYMRGKAACDGLKKLNGGASGGCPRPKPNYVEMMSTAPLK